MYLHFRFAAEANGGFMELGAALPESAYEHVQRRGRSVTYAEFSADACFCLFGSSLNWTASPYARHNRFECFSSSSTWFWILYLRTNSYLLVESYLYSVISTAIAVRANMLQHFCTGTVYLAGFAVEET
jgi:hypothetical protein